MADLKISLLEKSELKDAAKVLSIAMLNNPLHAAIFQGQREVERKEIEKMFLRLLEDLPGIVFLAKLEKQIMGVMRMKSCNGREVSDEYVKSEDVKDINWRKSYWHNEWARHDPTEQHWHLGPIGVLPAYQGTGIGTKLMRRFCHEVDTCLAAAYLETDLDKNVAFYGRFDFQIIAESEIFNVKNYYMWRPPIQRRDHGQKRRHP